MSLINQMLRDLEQRNTQKSASPQALRPQTAPRQTGSKALWFWLIALAPMPFVYLWLDDKAAVQPPVVALPQASKPQAAAIEIPAVNPVIMPAAAPQASIPAAPVQQTAQIQSVEAKPDQKQTERVVDTKLTKPAAILNESAKNPAQAPASSKPTISKPKTPTEQAETLYRQAKDSASLLIKQENLNEALRLNPAHLGARSLLLQTLIKSRAPNAQIKAFIDDSLKLFPGDQLFLKTQAHLYVQQKQFDAAARTLEAIDMEHVEDPSYLSLLAASYQQLQRYPQAEKVYQQLTRLQPDKAEHWLGLGISAEKQNHALAAAEAYQQALDKNTLNSEVVNYIKQRLSALN